MTRIDERASFDRIRYANVWEDADVLCAALSPLEGKRALSIASGGDNAFALAAEGAEVVAADLSFPQIAVVELKRTAIRSLEHPQLLEFLGVKGSSDRLALWRRLEHTLPENVRSFWGARSEEIERGIIHAGKFEAYFSLFRRFVVPLFHGRRAVKELLTEKGFEERERFYRETWDTWRWRLLFRIFFGRWMMGRLGRDPEFFRYVEGSVADRILERTRYAFTALETHRNPYLQFIFNGNYGPALPRYLRPEHFERVRAGCDRLLVVQDSVDSAAAAHGPFDRYNLSDLFEYLDPATVETVYGRLIEAAAPGARLAYWNMLAPRRRPDSLSAKIRSLDSHARILHERDLAFFY
ncbi:MAG: BtaA family protein, partial [Acidobacteria bacterium]|nr:BtaA family protein [Acidobacteriota bacterium]